MKIVAREVPPRSAWALEQAGVHPLLARLYAARGVLSAADLDDGLARLLPPHTMKGTREAAVLLADAIRDDRRLCVVADYDCDGATACAVAVRGLRLLGARQVGYLVPDRVVDGYGLTPPIAERVAATGAEVLITVDNGIASVEGVARAKALGLTVLVTDHHLPGPVLPGADVLVNPNQPGCEFESKSIAGVGVMFYVLLALRAELRARGAFAPPRPPSVHAEPVEAPREASTLRQAQDRPGSARTAGDACAPTPAQPKLDTLLPLVALGTVADVVKLDPNNRRLVAQGLKRIRAGALPHGVAALFQAAGRKADAATTFDFGFALGPRINAAGRLADMTLGIECLLSDDAGRCAELARTLDGINRERRDIEGGMREQALLLAESLFDENETPPSAISVFDMDFHEGVVGIVASRIKDLHHRPTFVFAASAADGKSHELKGSGRSIPGFHLRDALDLVAKRHPGVLLRFGGHAMAAGCTVARDQFETFERAFAQVAHEWLDAATLTRRLDTDGPLAREYLRIDLVDTLHREVWGQGFAPPTFSDEVEVVSQRLVGEKHLALKLRLQGQPIDGIWFGHTDPLPARVKLAFRLDADEWQGTRRLRLMVEGAETEPPRSPAARGPLPPGGALAALGRPGGGVEPPRSPAARGPLPPGGALAALGRPGGGEDAR
ncbi:MAG: single-stranded-DNA-specific exonuclease RecJ [Variovorax sp.]|nr:single-stranded-DNA-specific exonuclease RecJ [Variovorax sp.]